MYSFLYQSTEKESHAINSLKMTSHEKGINGGDLMAFRESDTKLKSMVPGLTSNHKPRDQNHLRGSRYDKEKLEKSSIQQESELKKSIITPDSSPSPFIKYAEASSPKKRNLRYHDSLSGSKVLIDDQDEDKSFYLNKLAENTPIRNRSKSKENFKSSNFDYSLTPTKKVFDDVSPGASENKEMIKSSAKGYASQSQSLVKMRNLSRDISTLGGYSSINIHNPITNPIPLTIQNPYIIKEIKQGNYRSKSQFVISNA